VPGDADRIEMSTRENRRIDRRTVELMLDGHPFDAPDRHPPLAGLLVAAAAPGRPAELVSEQECVAGFRAALPRRLDLRSAQTLDPDLAPVPQTRRLSMIKTAVLKLLTVKVVIAACATTAAGGVALAASTGNLPNPLDKHGSGVSSRLDTAPDSEKSKSSHGGDRDGDGKDGKDGNNGNGNGNGKQGNGPDASHAPSPSLVGLCHAYGSGNKADHGKALDNPAFTVLITTAGGRDKVDAFCATLLADPNAAKDTGKKDKPAKPEPTTTPGDNQSNGNGNGNGNGK
jgi:hypothetical protein